MTIGSGGDLHGEPWGAGLPPELVDLAAEQLLGVDGHERDRELAGLIADHPEHAAALRRLLAGLDGAERLLGGTWVAATDESPAHIGGYRVVRRLGEGAFGIVFLCAQVHPVVRDVAIKVLRPGAGDQHTLRRFGAERQLLASLNHPAITQVYDAGALPDGRPYFVMEYVDGVPIRSFCEQRGLPCRDRLRLFVDLCRGVAHAHARRIVHRDLKPANVLIVDTENGPMPKIIDFGIAKALFASADDTTPRTDAGRVVGTPGYMSPEQASGRIDEVDERADVFALGVILYELLTGGLPWAQGAAATDTEPQRPSARVGTSSGPRPAALVAERRQLAAALRGDLDWITLKALARERDRRYATARELALDIERHLCGQPVLAGPPTLTYRLRKFVRRNKPVLAALGGAAVLLAAGFVAFLAYGSAADAAIAEARSAAAASFADATAAVEQLLARANDERLRDAPRGDAARQALLQDALSFYDRFLVNRPADPALRAGRCRALLGIAWVHLQLGEPTRAVVTGTEATAEAELLLAAEPSNLEYRGLLAEAVRRQGLGLARAGNHSAALPKLAAAKAHLAACAAAAPATYGRSHALVLREAAQAIEPHRTEERIAGLQQSLQALEALVASHPQIEKLADDCVMTCTILAGELIDLQKFEEVDAILTKAEADLPRLSANRLQLTIDLRMLRGQVAWALRDQGQNRQAALAHWQGAVEAASAWQQEQPQRQLPYEQHVHALLSLGNAQNYCGAFAESAVSLRGAIGCAEAMVQRFPDDPSPLALLRRVLREFARLLWDRFRQQDLAEAADCAVRAVAVDDRMAPTVEVNPEPRWQLLGMQAVIADSRGTADAGRLWQEVEAALPTDPELLLRENQDYLIEALTGLARWHLVAGRSEAAADRLAQARERIAANPLDGKKRMVEVGWLEARLAGARADNAEMAAAADRILAARSTWFGKRRAADCLHLAWRCTTATPGSDADTATRYRDRAAALFSEVIADLRADVAREPQDPWFVLPWGFASVRAAELTAAAGDAAIAQKLLAEALPMLEGVRSSAHADQWEEQTVRDGRDLQARLATDRR